MSDDRRPALPDRALRRRPRVVYMAGPGDIVRSYRRWREGLDDPSQVADTYSGQFYQVCRDLGLEGLVISSHPRAERVDDPPFRLEHRPLRPLRASGVLHHLREIAYDVRLIAICVRFRADVVLLQGGYHYWFLFASLRLAGIKLIPILMVVIKLKFGKIKGYQNLLARVNGWFFRRSTWRILSASDDISRQVVEMTRGRSAPIEFFLPRFRADRLPARDTPPSPPFRVLFAGRVEKNKGVFDLLEVARLLVSRGRTDIVFDLCGAGGASNELALRVEASGMSDRFRLHGHCDHGEMGRMYGQAHVVVVPTTSEFVEGFNQVVIESVLSARPVVTSSVCPSLEYVLEAAVEVPPDDVEAYAAAIVRLADDPELYRRKQQACLSLRDRFLETDRDFGSVLGRVLAEALASGARPEFTSGGPAEPARSPSRPWPIDHELYQP
ncbi:MAG: glycosyltransferase family 4 protein [Isosphaeraceae bacterium]|nr:glycosyltransferase family 4 protein [Isosphaeraceae bacterium]